MAMDTVDQLVNSAVELSARWVLLSGGEATQHPQWEEAARRFHQAGLHVMLLTNALHLERQAEKLPNAVHEVIVSLDGGTAATYQHIRGVNGLSRVHAGIKAAKQVGARVTTRTTIQRDNYHELPLIIDNAREAGADLISFLAVDISNPFAFGERDDLYVQNPAALTADDISAFEQLLNEVETHYEDLFDSGQIAESPAKLRRMANYFRAINGEIPFDGPRCNAPHISTVVEVDGTVRPCYFLPAIGKLNGKTLVDILNSESGTALRRAYSTGERQECARCVCPLYKGPRALATL